MKLKDFNYTSTYYEDMLKKVREQIIDSVRALVEKMGGAISARYYHDDCDTPRFTFFTVDNDGHGVELFVDKVETEGDDLLFTMVDTEDSYEYQWELADFNASNANYLLQDLEEIANYIVENDEEIVAEYPED